MGLAIASICFPLIPSMVLCFVVVSVEDFFSGLELLFEDLVSFLCDLGFSEVLTLLGHLCRLQNSGA